MKIAFCRPWEYRSNRTGTTGICETVSKHASFPFFRFFEWGRNVKGKKEMVAFAPDGYDLMWAPALYDSWVSKDNKMSFHSFAVITGDPPAEIEEQGHDRCPIFLQEPLVDDWLRPQGKPGAYFYELLQCEEPVHYRHLSVD